MQVIHWSWTPIGWALNNQWLTAGAVNTLNITWCDSVVLCQYIKWVFQQSIIGFVILQIQFAFAKMFFEAMLWITELIHWTKNNWLAWFSLKYIHNCCSQNCDQGLYSLPFIRSWLHLNASGRFTWSLQDYGKFCISRNFTKIYPIVVACLAAKDLSKIQSLPPSLTNWGLILDNCFEDHANNSLLCWSLSIRHWLVRKWWNSYSSSHHFSLLLIR